MKGTTMKGSPTYASVPPGAGRNTGKASPTAKHMFPASMEPNYSGARANVKGTTLPKGGMVKLSKKRGSRGGAAY